MTRWPSNSLDRFSERLDRLVGVIAPAAMRRRIENRAQAKFAYEAIDQARQHIQQLSVTGGADVELTESALATLRNQARYLGQNNPLVAGILDTEADGVVGDSINVQARSSDEGWNQAREQLWSETMVDVPCESTGRFDFAQSVRLAFMSYRRDGDFFIIFRDDSVELVEGHQCGTPWGRQLGVAFTVTNGVARSNQTGEVLGYYIGRPNVWGYIEPSGYQQIDAARVAHVFNPRRISYSRGEPVLTSAVTTIDLLGKFENATLWAAHIAAMMGVFRVKKDPSSIRQPYTQGNYPSGETADGRKVESIQPGQIADLEPGEDIKTVIPNQPSPVYRDFVNLCMMKIGRPLCFPLMLVTLDFAGATFMNARVAYQQAHEHWRMEQRMLKRLARRWYLWRTQRDIDAGLLGTPPADWQKHEIIFRGWEYVNPQQESSADEIDLRNATVTRGQILCRRGIDFREFMRQGIRERQIEEQELADAGLKPQEPPVKENADAARK